jgi:hypothetical protein
VRRLGRLLVAGALGAIVIITWSDSAAAKGAKTPAMAWVVGVGVGLAVYAYAAARAAWKRRKVNRAQAAAAMAKATGRRRGRVGTSW